MTGDESATDTTCGDDGVGELGAVLGFYVGLDCVNPPSTSFMGLVGNDAGAGRGPLEPGETICGSAEVGVLTTAGDQALTDLAGALAHDLYMLASRHGLGRKDFSSVIQLLTASEQGGPG